VTRRRLVDKVKGADRSAKMDDTFIRAEPGVSESTGITVDGIHFDLDGQPPTAQTAGWGERPGG
jgi:hypothetical protein